MNKKIWALISLLLIATMMLGACAKATEAPAPTKAAPAEVPPTEAAPAEVPPTEAAAPTGGEVYYLNFKPEVAEIYQKIADEYKKETGVTLKVVTAAAGTYEQTLKSEIAKSDAPVLFQINGPRGYESWKDYTGKRCECNCGDFQSWIGSINA